MRLVATVEAGWPIDHLGRRATVLKAQMLDCTFREIRHLSCLPPSLPKTNFLGCEVSLGFRHPWASATVQIGIPSSLKEPAAKLEQSCSKAIVAIRRQDHCEQVYEQTTCNASCIVEVAAPAGDSDMARCPARQSSRSSPVSLFAPPAPGMRNRRIS